MGNLIAYSHDTLESLKSRCTYVHELPVKERCDFIIKLDCDSESYLIDYHKLIFCDIPIDRPEIYYVLVILMFIFFVLLFYYLGVVVDQFFCPAIGVISDILRLSENLSGVTLLALGNALPDIITSMVSSSDGDTIMMYNQLLGGSMFVTCFVAGLIAYNRPFHFEIFPFLRDMLFTIASVALIVYINEKTIHRYVFFAFFGIYFSYIGIAIAYFFIDKRNDRHKKDLVDWTELRRPCIINETDLEEIILNLRKKNLLVDPEEEKDTYESYLKEFWNDLKTFSKDEWQVMNCWQRFLIIVESPLIIFRFFIPNVCFGSPRNGWSKLLNTINVALYPTFIGICFNLNFDVYGINSFIIFVFAGFLCGILVFVTSKKEVQPPYHFIFPFLNLCASIIVIYKLVNEIVSILTAFGTILGLQSQVLVITVLAWGNGLGDAVTNISLARQGFQRMAFSGCLAGSLTTMCLSFGINLFSSEEEMVEIRSGSMGPVCTVFILANLAFSLLFMLLTNFKARRSYGMFLIMVYIEFLVFCVLTALHIIHPIGSDQEETDNDTTETL